MGSPIPPRTPVRLRLWGVSEAAIARARADCARHEAYPTWEIAVTERNTGHPSTIMPADREAIAQRAGAGWAWAAYRLRGAAPRRPL